MIYNGSTQRNKNVLTERELTKILTTCKYYAYLNSYNIWLFKSRMNTNII